MARPKKSSKSIKCSIYVEPEFKMKLEQIAVEEDRSFSYMVNKAIEQYLSLEKEAGKKGQEGATIKKQAFDLTTRELPKF